MFFCHYCNFYSTRPVVMSESNALFYFRAAYLVSIIFGTMPVKLQLSLVHRQPPEPPSSDTNIDVKFAIMSIAWTALVSAFIISDIKTISGLSPTSFFSKKIIDNFPNDYYCIRLLGNAEICVLLICSSFVVARKLPYIVEQFRSYRIQQLRQGQTKSRKTLPSKITYLLTFYSFLTALPILNDLAQLYRETEHLDVHRITQEILHCIPISVNLQFCCLCIIFSCELDALNETIRESCSSFPENVRKLGQSHSAICQLVRQLNRTYRLQLFLETGIVTLNILLHTFHVLNANNHKLQSRYADITCSSLWTAHYAGRLFTTCMLASNTVTQAKQTRRVLLQLQDFNQISINHEQIISLVNRITNQDMNFDICGFFVLDGNLIISICSWCISFILILLQFRMPT